MFNKLLFPIFSFVSVGGVAVGFSKYNNNSAVNVDSLLHTKNNNSAGAAIKATVNKTDNQLEDEKTKEYFYSVVEVDRGMEDIEDMECEQAQPVKNLKTRFACSLFDFSDSKNSTSPISGIRQKINAKLSNLSLVVKPLHRKYYLLRTEQAINNAITKIGLKKINSNVPIGIIDLENGWEKNIQKTN